MLPKENRGTKKDMNTPKHLIDTTLREGEQTVGIHFTTEQKKEIIKGLALVGISEIEIGIASPLTRDLAEIMDYCRAYHPGMKISLWCRCKEEDVFLRIHTLTRSPVPFHPDLRSASEH